MRSEAIVRLCLDYSNGFKELANSKSGSDRLKAFFKILSYTLIFPPIIMACLYFHHRKIARLESNFDQLIDKMDAYKSHEAFMNIYSKDSKDIRQKDILQCLFIKISNLDYEDLNTPEGKKEVERFQKGFKLLSLDKQHDLFLKLIENGLMSKLLNMDLLPKDIQELYFTLGASKIQNLEENDALAMKFFAQLSEFKSLNNIRLDLKSLGFFGPAACQTLDNLSKVQLKDRNIHYFFPQKINTTINRDGRELYYLDRSSPISNALVQIRKSIDRSNEQGQHFEYHLDFTNLLIHGDNKGKIHSWEKEKTFEAHKEGFVENIVSFLHQKKEKIPNC